MEVYRRQSKYNPYRYKTPLQRKAFAQQRAWRARYNMLSDVRQMAESMHGPNAWYPKRSNYRPKGLSASYRPKGLYRPKTRVGRPFPKGLTARRPTLTNGLDTKIATSPFETLGLKAQRINALFRAHVAANMKAKNDAFIAARDNVVENNGEPGQKRQLEEGEVAAAAIVENDIANVSRNVETERDILLARGQHEKYTFTE